MSLIPLLFVFCLFNLVTNSQKISAVSNLELGNTFTRLSYEAHPSGAPTQISIKGVRLTLDSIDNTSAQARAQALGYSIVNPTDNNNAGNLGFYFGYFDAQVNYDIGKSHNSASISGSLLELFVNFAYLFVYYDRDSVPGYQYHLGDPIDCLTVTSSSVDCIDLLNSITLKNLHWAPISVKRVDCPANYSSDCLAGVMNIYTTGNDSGIANFTFKLASQPMYIDDVLVTPDHGKIDLSINYPWQRFPNLKQNPKIGIIAGGAGKTLSTAVTINRRNNKPGIEFNNGGKIGSFRWDETSTISKRGASSPVHFENITGNDLLDTCVNKVCNPVLTYLTLVASAWKILGWKVAILIFSWDSVQPGNVYWDPEIGLTTIADTPSTPTSTPSSTPTDTPSTPTSTPSSTPTDTPSTPTSTPSSTPTGTPGPTPTGTPGPTPTGTPGPTPTGTTGPTKTPGVSSGLVVSVFLICLFSVSFLF